MKSKFTAIAFILTSGLLASAPSFAGVTSKQVQTELAAAIRSGDIVAGESSFKLNELYPNRYSVQQLPSSVTREKVKADLAAAVRSGNLQANGETGAKLNALYPSQYPAAQAPSNLTREQVQADLENALRTGYIIASGEFPVN